MLEEVRNNDYYLSYSDLDWANQELMASFNQKNEIIENPGLWMINLWKKYKKKIWQKWKNNWIFSKCWSYQRRKRWT